MLFRSAEILDTYRKDHDWSAYVRKFRPLMVQRNALGWKLKLMGCFIRLLQQISAIFLLGQLAQHRIQPLLLRLMDILLLQIHNFPRAGL